MARPVDFRNLEKIMAKPTVTIAEAQAIASVTRRTLYNWMEQKKIQWKVTAGGTRRIITSTLLKDEPVKPVTES